MGVKKFMELVKETLGLDEMKKASKKKSIKKLLNKLHAKRKTIRKELKVGLDKERKKELVEEKDIITFQIKKGNAILKKLKNEENLTKRKKEKNAK